MSLPPRPENERAGLAPKAAEAAFGAVEPVASGRAPAARLAALDAAGRVLFATPKALECFEAKDDRELERRLLSGDGPSARRLRRLAASMPLGEAPRLERLSVWLGRRPVSLNLLCARVATPEAPVLLLWEPSPRAAEAPVAAPPAAAPQEPRLSEAPPQEAAPPDLASADEWGAAPLAMNARFLWSLDKDGRFGAPDPVLARALGPNAPAAGETLAALASRMVLAETDALARAFEKRETFSDLLILWPLAEGRRQARIRLSAAPVFDRGREFAGFRGFGRIGEMVEPPRPASAPDLRPTAAEPSDGRAAEVEAPAPQSKPAAGPAADERESSVASTSAAPAEAAATPAEPGAEAEGAAHEPESLTAASGDTAAAPVRETLPGAGPAPSSSDPSRGEPAPERTAEIYILRQSHAQPAKVVPIRPGALEALPPPEPASAAGGESVELSKSERDAFREIARALVGRPASARREGEAGPAAEPSPAADDKDRAEASAPLPPSAGAALEETPEELPADSGKPQPSDAAAILDRLPIGVMVVREARALYLNRALIDLLGYRDFAHFEAADGLAGLFKGRDPEAVSSSGSGAAPIPIMKADGSAIAVDGRAQAVTWGGAPATLIAFRRLKEPQDGDRQPPPGADRSRNGSADELQALLDHATDGAVALDPAGRIVSLNRPAEQLFGYEERDVVGESVLMLLQPQSHPETTARLEALSRDAGASAPFSVVGRDRAGQPLPLALTLAKIGSGEAPHFGALVRDLRREREAERRLVVARDAARAASAAKTDFLAQVSHEIRTPLHAILGFAEVMMEERFGPVGNERYKDYLKDIHASGKHVMSLADDLLDLSKIEAGKFELAFTAVDANALIRECVSLMQPEATRERVIMRVSLFEHLPRVMADVRSLKQIMLNLISNAVKFNEPGGQVIVSTALDPTGQAVIRVRDTGVGMSESEVGVALEPFGRIAGAGRKGGVGLGLPLTKALVEANGAEFSIKSRREHGTLIEIAFPVANAAE